MDEEKSIREKSIDELYDLVCERRKEGKIVYDNGFDGLVSVPLDAFIKQGTSGMLYDLNRLDEVQITLAKSDEKVDLISFLPNNLAMVTLVDYLVNERAKLIERAAELEGNKENNEETK